MRLRKHLFLVLILFIVFQSCKKNKDWNFIIEGQLFNAPANTYARLYKAEPTGNVFIDSVLLEKDGKFKLYGKTTGKDFFVINFTNQNYNIYLIVDSADYIYLTADYNSLLSSYRIRGSQESHLIQLLEQHLDSTRGLIDSLALLYKDLLDHGKQDSAMIVDSLIKRTIVNQKEFSTNFVYDHYNSLVALPALSQVYHPGQTIFDPEADAQLYFLVDTALGRLFPKNLHVLRLHSFVQNIKLNLQRRQSTSWNIRPNAKAPDFEIKDIEGNIIHLSDYKGKYVYLIFTASWCNSCKESVRKIYKYNKKLVKIAYILDIDSSAAINMSQQYLKNFIVITDGRFWNSPVVKKYEVKRIPMEFLISPQGKIIAINDDIAKVLESIH